MISKTNEDPSAAVQHPTNGLSADGDVTSGLKQVEVNAGKIKTHAELRDAIKFSNSLWTDTVASSTPVSCGPLFFGRRCSGVGNNKYCNADTGECGSSDLHQFAQLGNEFDSPDIVDAGRCGPLFDGRVCNCNGYEVYCNTANGWCGSGDADKNAQVGKEYDCPYFVSFPTSFSFTTTTCSFDSTKIYLCH